MRMVCDKHNYMDLLLFFDLDKFSYYCYYYKSLRNSISPCINDDNLEMTTQRFRF